MTGGTFLGALLAQAAEQPAAGDKVGWLARIWEDYLNRRIPVGNFGFSAVTLAQGVIALALALLLSRYLRAFIERRLARRTIDPGTQYTLLRLIHYAIFAVGLLLAFRLAFSADLTSLAVLFTALSVGIGFGLQYLAGDIASGFVLLFERPVRVGDFVTVEGVDSKIIEGKVQSINLRATVVLTNDHIAVIVPNSKLVNQSIINWSTRDRRSRISIPVGVAYDSDVELVTRTLLRAAEGVDHLLEAPKPSVQFLGFGESSLNFRLLVWTGRPRRHPKIKSDINYRIHRLFRDEGLVIPFPQRDLNLRAASLRLKTGPESLPPSGDADEVEGERELELHGR